MEFILGAMLPFLGMLIAYKLFIPYKKQSSIKIVYRQTNVFEAMKPAIPFLKVWEEPKETQSSKYEARNSVKVLMVENQAYWIKDNSVYVADIVDGNVDQSGAKVVDTMTMDKVQLDRLSFIIDKLTKGDSNDSGYPGIS